METLRLSDAFLKKAPIEIEVVCYNINKEIELKDKSTSLDGYSLLIREIKKLKK